GIDIHGGIDQCGFDAVALGNFDETIRIGRVLRADDENEVDIFGNLFDGVLAILRGVADVVALGADDLGELLAETSDDFLRVVQAQSGLGEEREFIGIAHFELVYGFDRIHDDGAVGRFAGSADDFLMVFVADKNDGAVFASELERFEMDLGDEGAGGVDDFERPSFGFVADGRRNTVGAEDENGTMRNFFDSFDENGATAAKLLDYR